MASCSAPRTPCGGKRCDDLRSSTVFMIDEYNGDHFAGKPAAAGRPPAAAVVCHGCTRPDEQVHGRLVICPSYRRNTSERGTREYTDEIRRDVEGL